MTTAYATGRHGESSQAQGEYPPTDTCRCHLAQPLPSMYFRKHPAIRAGSYPPRISDMARRCLSWLTSSTDSAIAIVSVQAIGEWPTHARSRNRPRPPVRVNYRSSIPTSKTWVGGTPTHPPRLRGPSGLSLHRKSISGKAQIFGQRTASGVLPRRSVSHPHANHPVGGFGMFH